MRGMLFIAVTAACGRIGFDVVLSGDGLGGDGAAVRCGELAPTCGPTQSSPCCESLIVTGGTYARSYDVTGDGMYPDGSYGATVSAFRLDKYEVTVGRFRQFVTAGFGTQMSPPIVATGAHPNISNSGWDASWSSSLLADTTTLVAALQCNFIQTWTDTPGANENRPINCVTWYEAMAFCVWDGGFLPTEAEWNYAAAGGDEQRAYAWSSPAASLSADNTRASYGCLGDGTSGCAVTDLLPVGSKPAGDGRWGQSDLGGNLLESTLDYFVTPYLQNPCTDCANFTPTLTRVYRGGGLGNSVIDLRVSARFNATPTVRGAAFGFRCARSAL